eukprot:TRINITY_DN7318_c0_g1_i1.p1 TRINITY_DN7318_c0_g1~~TRINITY_DN7318_c0_g1_i1.p1  ORF type:complete len:421 (+),score=95.21 TRINITY_DN7318_c0_g1_i1:30-1292(+)
MSDASVKAKLEYFPANYAQAISKLIDEEEESSRPDFVTSLSIGLSLGMAPHVEWVREKLFQSMLHPNTSPKTVAMISQHVVHIYSKYGSKNYKLFLDGEKSDWEWLDKILTAQIGIFESDTLNLSAMENIGIFYSTLNKIFDLNEKMLRGETPSESDSSSDASVNSSMEPVTKKSKKQKDVPIFSRLHQATTEEDAQMRKHLLLWSIFDNAHATAKAVHSFTRGMVRLLQSSQLGTVTTSLATTLGKLIDCIVRFRLHDDLLAPIAESLSDNDVSTTLRLTVYRCMPHGEGKLRLVDHMLRAFDFAKENLALEAPPSVDKFIGVMLHARPFACVQKNKKDLDPVEVGMKYSYYEQALCTFHALASLLELHPDEVRSKSSQILEGVGKLRALVHAALRQNPRGGTAAEDLFVQMELILNAI